MESEPRILPVIVDTQRRDVAIDYGVLASRCRHRKGTSAPQIGMYEMQKVELWGMG